jgi:hypothetical protein
MKAISIFILIYMAPISAIGQANAAVPRVTRVATAVNHLTVLEFHETVAMAAAGSPDFQIERQQNKVFIKPLKPGVATDLFIWTQSGRYAYELETTGEVGNMSFAIDNAPSISPQPVTNPTDEMVDLLTTKVLLGAESIQAPQSRVAKDRVNVRVEEVFRTKSSIYLHFSVDNKTKQPWHVSTPTANYLQASDESPRLTGLIHQQLDQKALEQFADVSQTRLSVVHMECETDDLQPSEKTQGILVIRARLDSPTILQLIFAPQVTVIVVL